MRVEAFRDASRADDISRRAFVVVRVVREMVGSGILLGLRHLQVLQVRAPRVSFTARTVRPVLGDRDSETAAQSRRFPFIRTPEPNGSRRAPSTRRETSSPPGKGGFVKRLRRPGGRGLDLNALSVRNIFSPVRGGVPRSRPRPANGATGAPANRDVVAVAIGLTPPLPSVGSPGAARTGGTPRQRGERIHARGRMADFANGLGRRRL